MSSEKSETANQPMKLRTRTECNLSGIDDVWDVDEMDEAGMIRDAVEDVRDDHEKEITFEVNNIWMFKVHWNENTDSVWVGRYGYNGGMEVDDGE